MRISLCYEKNEKDFTYKYLVYNMFLTDYFKKSMMKGTNIVDDSNNDRSGWSISERRSGSLSDETIQKTGWKIISLVPASQARKLSKQDPDTLSWEDKLRMYVQEKYPIEEIMILFEEVRKIYDDKKLPVEEQIKNFMNIGIPLLDILSVYEHEEVRVRPIAEKQKIDDFSKPWWKNMTRFLNYIDVNYVETGDNLEVSIHKNLDEKLNAICLIKITVISIFLMEDQMTGSSKKMALWRVQVIIEGIQAIKNPQNASSSSQEFTSIIPFPFADFFISREIAEETELSDKVRISKKPEQRMFQLFPVECIQNWDRLLFNALSLGEVEKIFPSFIRWHLNKADIDSIKQIRPPKIEPAQNAEKNVPQKKKGFLSMFWFGKE